MASDRTPNRRFRSRDWFDDPEHLDMVALYLERFMNYGLTAEELLSGRPIIGIAQTGGDLTPCNRVHLDTVKRVREGIRDAGGVPMEFPLHPIFENCRRPTAALDRNLAYLGLVEILHGYPIDAVVLTTGCDKTTPAADHGGLDRRHSGHRAVRRADARRLARGRAGRLGHGDLALAPQARRGPDQREGVPRRGRRLGAVARPLQHHGHGVDDERRRRGARPVAARLRGDSGAVSRARPDGLRDRPPHRRAWRTRTCGLRRSSRGDAFLNAIAAIAAIGGSTNAQPHLVAMARHAGIEITPDDWMTYGRDVPLLVNMQPAGKYLGERFHRAGGVPAVLVRAAARRARSTASALTVTGRTLAENVAGPRLDRPRSDHDRTRSRVQEKAGFLVLKGNLFDFAIMKTSVISAEFRKRYLRRRRQLRVPRGGVRRLGRLSRSASTIRRSASTSTPSS